MPRYFIEVAYDGSNYSGFQIQENANSVQAEVEKALQIFFRQKVELTGSSRTDAGVHARQNFFHADFETIITNKDPAYHLNAILPDDICIKNIILVKDEAHCRFDAKSRAYCYYIYSAKNPFSNKIAWQYPYSINIDLLNAAATELKNFADFTSFSKRNTQVNNFNCTIIKSEWYFNNDILIYNVKANRFLRGMVRALVATMLHVGRKKITVEEFIKIIEAKDNSKADFAAPAHGLFLERVEY